MGQPLPQATKKKISKKLELSLKIVWKRDQVVLIMVIFSLCLVLYTITSPKRSATNRESIQKGRKIQIVQASLLSDLLRL